MNKVMSSKVPPWRGRGHEILLRIARNPLRFRVGVLTAAVLYTCWTLWGRTFQNQQGLSRFTLLITLAWVMPYFIYVAGVRSKGVSVAGGAALGLTHLILFSSITNSQSSTAALGFLFAHFYLYGIALAAAMVDLIWCPVVSRRGRRTET